MVVYLLALRDASSKVKVQVSMTLIFVDLTISSFRVHRQGCEVMLCHLQLLILLLVLLSSSHHYVPELRGVLKVQIL